MPPLLQSIRSYREISIRIPVRTFIIYPVLVIVWELIWNRGYLDIEPIFLPLMAWGYLQYRLCGRFALNMVAAVRALKPRRIASFQPDLTPTPATRCTWAI
jgi:hypothetical protein